jgi:hypothetical protein
MIQHVPVSAVMMQPPNPYNTNSTSPYTQTCVTTKAIQAISNPVLVCPVLLLDAQQ